MPRLVRLAGLAIDASPFRMSSGRFRVRISPTAFDSFVTAAGSKYVPILIGHKRHFELPRVGPITWTPTKNGLQVSLAIDASKPLGRAVELAVQHGFLPKLSLSFFADRKTFTTDQTGVVETVTQARIAELSLTNKPACPGTTIAIAGQPRAARTSLPADRTERAMLVSFLKRIGIDPTPQVPVLQTEARAKLAKMRADERYKREAKLSCLIYDTVYSTPLPPMGQPNALQRAKSAHAPPAHFGLNMFV